MDDFFSDFDEQPKKRRPGRPKGSKSRSEEEIVTERVITRSFKRMRPYCSEEDREYLDKVLRGEVEMDAMVEYRILTRQLMLVFADESEAILMGDRKPTKEYAELANAYRMTLKDAEDIRKARRKDEEAAAQKDTLHFEEVQTERQRIEEAINRSIGKK